MKTSKKNNDKSKDKKMIYKSQKLPNKELNLEKLPTNYFRLLKEMEKNNNKEKLKQELNIKNNNNNQNNKKKKLTEVIYNENSKKLRNYYDKNQKDLTLVGSSKYDVLPMNNFLKEMTNYKERVIERLASNDNNNDDSKINSIIENYANCRDKVILTPLAENEKERNEMEKLEKKKFDEAERTGVVMRRIEYTSTLDKRADFAKNEENKEIIQKYKNSVDLIGKFWLKYKERKKRKYEQNSRLGKFSFSLMAKNTKKLVETIKNLEIFKKWYEDMKKEKENKEKELMMKNKETKNLNNLYNNLKSNLEKKK